MVPIDIFDFGPCTLGTTDLTASSSSPEDTLSLDFNNLPCANMLPNLSYELSFPPTVYGALYINGQILGLSCSIVIASKSRPVSDSVPGPLRPTPTQLSTVHYQSIDRFPFPKFRDNMISMSQVVDEEEFTRDIFTLPSFVIKAGGVSWDPRCWKIEKVFAEKWGFLFV